MGKNSQLRNIEMFEADVNVDVDEGRLVLRKVNQNMDIVLSGKGGKPLTIFIKNFILKNLTQECPYIQEGRGAWTICIL